MSASSVIDMWSIEPFCVRLSASLDELKPEAPLKFEWKQYRCWMKTSFDERLRSRWLEIETKPKLIVYRWKSITHVRSFIFSWISDFTAFKGKKAYLDKTNAVFYKMKYKFVPSAGRKYNQLKNLKLIGQTKITALICTFKEIGWAGPVKSNLQHMLVLHGAKDNK